MSDTIWTARKRYPCPTKPSRSKYRNPVKAGFPVILQLIKDGVERSVNVVWYGTGEKPRAEAYPLISGTL